MSNNFEELEKLHDLKEKGILTEEEYLSQKDLILNKSKNSEGMAANNLWETYTNAWRKYFKFKGRASRYDYWGFTLINFLITLGLSILSAITALFGFISGLYSLLIIIPSLAIMYRRLHDTNRSGWWIGSLLISFPVVVIIAAISAVVNYANVTSSLFSSLKTIIFVIVGFWWVIQLIMVIVFMFFKGDAEANKYGEPVAQTPAQDKTGKIISICFLVFYLLLPIIGILSVAGIAGYSKAVGKYSSNKAIDEITMVAANTRTLYASQNSYDGLSNAMAISTGIVPKDMQSGENIKNSFGGDVYIVGRGSFFMVEFTNVPKDKCETFMTTDWGNGLQTILFDNNVSSCSDCPKEGCPMIWVFN